MNSSTHFRKVAHRLGCEVRESDGDWLIRRQNEVVRLSYSPGDSREMRFRNFAILLGVRLGLDRLLSTYSFENERPTGDEAPRNAYEQPPIYGRRVQYLLPWASLTLAEVVSGVRFFQTDWVDPDLTIAYLLEHGKEWHLFAEPDFERVEFDQANLAEFGRLALFYDSKPRPKTISVPGGTLRVYASTAGLQASMATLLPDYDYDAAQSKGFACIASRDCLIVGEVNAPDRAGDVLKSILELAEAEAHREFMPFPLRAYALAQNKISVMERFASYDEGDLSVQVFPAEPQDWSEL